MQLGSEVLTEQVGINDKFSSYFLAITNLHSLSPTGGVKRYFTFVLVV